MMEFNDPVVFELELLICYAELPQLYYVGSLTLLNKPINLWGKGWNFS
jgi:hypothetical protein